MLQGKSPHRIFLTGILLFLLLPLWSAYINYIPITVKQPDGTELNIFASGDEYYNWLHDKDGFTIKQNDKGWYVFVERSGDELVLTNLIASRDNPNLRNIVPWTNISAAKMGQKRRDRQQQMQDSGGNRAPTTGTINNLVIYIRFSDQSEFIQNQSYYGSMCNGTGNTMQAYFNEASYNALNVSTTFYPTPTTTVVSWQDSHPRGFYSPYNATSNTIGYQDTGTSTTREHTLLYNAVIGIRSLVPASLNIDSDSDGLVDNVCFIVQGSTDAWAQLLWPHRWSLTSFNVSINGKLVYDYNFQLSDFLDSGGNGVLCHEMFHSLGAPDLYHYTDNGISPVGAWDLMENDTNPPQHMGAYMKWKYGHWISSIPTITANGTYTLNPLTSSTGNCYRINSPSSTSQYFIVEYRRKAGTFENQLPSSGLLVYRINTDATDGNGNGPPDEVYIYRLNGTTTVNGAIASANFSAESGRTLINNATNPSPFLSTGAAGGLSIYNISSADSTISFTKGTLPAGMPTCDITAPLLGASFSLGDIVAINVTATDTAPGSIARVDFFLDGTLIPTYTDNSSPYAWAWDTAGISSGTHTIVATAIDSDNNATSDQVTFAVLAPASEGFETGAFNAYDWTQSGNLPWSVQAVEKYSGSYAAKSGILSANQTSTLAVILNITTAGNVSFFQKTFSQSIHNHDLLFFYIDNVQMGSWSRDAAWTMMSFPVSSGTHEFKWTYKKDGTANSGSDCAYLDHIIFPPHNVLILQTIIWSPSSFTQQLDLNQTAIQNLSIGNTGNHTLNYACYLPTGLSTVLDETFATTAIPTGWTHLHDVGTTDWIFTTGGHSSNPSTAFDGTYNALLYKSLSSATTKLITPSLDLAGANSATLTFWHAQKVWTSGQDTLRVYYRTTATGIWTLLNTYSSNITAWTQRTINLPNLTGTYYIGFQGITDYGYGVCLDKVVVTKQSCSATPWLLLDNANTFNGIIVAGGAANTIPISFNSSGLSYGIYNSTITVTSNSITNSTFTIPVTLTVQNLPPPGTPLNTSIASDPSTGDMTIAWSAASGNPTGYRIYQSTTPSFEPAETSLVGTKTAAETAITIPAASLPASAFFYVIAYR